MLRWGEADLTIDCDDLEAPTKPAGGSILVPSDLAADVLPVQLDENFVFLKKVPTLDLKPLAESGGPLKKCRLYSIAPQMMPILISRMLHGCQ